MDYRLVLMNIGKNFGQQISQCSYTFFPRPCSTIPMKISDILSCHYFSFSRNSKLRSNTTSRKKNSLGESSQNFCLVELSSYSTFSFKEWDEQIEFPFTFWKGNWLEQLFIKLNFSQEEMSKSSILISPMVRVEWAESHISVLLIDDSIKIFNMMRYFDSLITNATF